MPEPIIAAVALLSAAVGFGVGVWVVSQIRRPEFAVGNEIVDDHGWTWRVMEIRRDSLARVTTSLELVHPQTATNREVFTQVSTSRTRARGAIRPRPSHG